MFVFHQLINISVNMNMRMDRVMLYLRHQSRLEIIVDFNFNQAKVS